MPEVLALADLIYQLRGDLNLAALKGERRFIARMIARWWDTNGREMADTGNGGQNAASRYLLAN